MTDLPPEVLPKLNELLRALQRARNAYPDLTVSRFALLIEVALHPGRTQAEILPLTGFTRHGISRAARLLQAPTKHCPKALDWVRWEGDADDIRLKRLFLTAKGRAFLVTVFD